MKSKLILALFIAPSLLLMQSCSEEKKTEEKEAPKQLVVLGVAQQEKFTHEIRVQGNVETDQDVMINAEMGGLITSINVKEGQTVSKGQVIAQVDAAVLSSNVQELQSQLKHAEYMLSKQEQLNERGLGTEIELETAKNQVNSLKASINSLNTQRGKSTIRAPFSGQIDQVYARKGQMTGPSAPIARLVNNNKIDIVASISEKHFAKIKIGTPIRVTFPNYADTAIFLEVNSIGNYIEPTNRTFRIKASILKNDYFLPNMLAEVSITDMEIESGLTIPSKSVIKDQDNADFVYVAEKHTSKKSKGKQFYKVSKLNVIVIERYNGVALIKEGALKKGQSIVTEGARGIAHGDIVRIK